ncbi:MAG: ATP-binding protein [Armatimonadia bacterium]
MWYRKYWIRRVEEAWQRRNVVWLYGVRRVGKTVLCQSLADTEYLDCELPRVRQALADPEGFLSGLVGKRVVLDEVQRLDNPSELLKIAADHYPGVKVLATGSSTLGASRKFRDTLTGRKAEVWLTPMMSQDLQDFEQNDLDHRLRLGGLPPFFLSKDLPALDYEQWLDSYWARDVQELFRLERRDGFRQLLQLLFVQSGGILSLNRLAKQASISHTTGRNYLEVLETTQVVHLVRPYSTYRATEITSAPKVYAFDTGFVRHFRGWNQLRPEDFGLLWEHYVLNELNARIAYPQVNYWRDKRGHEVDFVLAHPQAPLIAIECKRSVATFEPQSLFAFRKVYPEGLNWVVGPDVAPSFRRRYDDLEVDFLSIDDLNLRLTQLKIT